jgi:hypothetical protein
MINAIGFGWTNTIMTVISYGGMVCVILTLRYGSTWRERANARYGVTYKEADESKPEQADVVQEDGIQEDVNDRVMEMRGRGVKRTPSALPQPEVLLRRTHSLTEAHH